MTAPRCVARLAAAALLVLLAALAGPAWSGGRLACEDAQIFSAAAVNAVVLPYRYERGGRSEGGGAGGRLAALIQQETLFAMLKYGSVGATELVSERGNVCDVREIIDRILRSSRGGLRPGHGLVVIWGRIFEERSEIFIQSYVRFFRRDDTESIAVALAESAGGRPLELEAVLPAQAVAMPPRRITVKDLAEIERRAAATLILHKEPRASSPGKHLGSTPKEPLTYGVIATKGDWMQVQSHTTMERGWMLARVDDEEWSVRRFLPELAYVDGVIGYLRLRMRPKFRLATDPGRMLAWMQRGFDQYEKAVGRDAAAEASGLARAMRGVLLWSQPDLMAEDGKAAAARLFREAAVLMPDSAGAQSLAAVTAPFLAPTPVVDKTAVAAINRGLLGAVAVEPRNAVALSNLRKLYEFASGAPAIAPYGADELGTRLGVLRTMPAGPR